MRDARFTIPTPALLSRVADIIDRVPMEDRDTKGDLYEYMLGKIATAGQNGQFRPPRHIIKVASTKAGIYTTMCRACLVCGLGEEGAMSAATRLEFSLATRSVSNVRGERSDNGASQPNDAEARRERQMVLAKSILDDYEPALRELARR